MKVTLRGYKKPEAHDQLEHSVSDIADTFELMDADITKVINSAGDADSNSEELLWQNIKNTAEISLMKGVMKNG